MAAMTDFNEMTIEEHEQAIRELEMQQAKLDALVWSELVTIQTTLERQILEALTQGGIAEALNIATQLVAVEKIRALAEGRPPVQEQVDRLKRMEF